MLKRYFMILALGLSLAFAPVVVSAKGSAMEAVRNSVEAILDILKKGDALDKDTRRSAMKAEIDKRFDFRAMSQRTLATNWKKATEAEKQEFTDLFSQLIQNRKNNKSTLKVKLSRNQ